MSGAAITAIGAVTGHGFGARAYFDALLEGRSAIAPITRFSTEPFCSQLGAEAPADERLLAALPSSWAPPVDRASRLLLAAAAEAFVGRSCAESVRRGIVVGTTKGAFELSLDAWKRGEPAPLDPVGHPAALLARAVGARGPVRTIGAACASSTLAFAEALCLLEDGSCDEVVVGGVEALHPFVYAGFHALKALSAQPARPFDAARTGLSLGEGAAVLVLERARGVPDVARRALGWVDGCGASVDSHDQTAPDPAGLGLLRASREALRRANLVAQKVGHYQAHGTATAQNDRMEAAHCRALFQERTVPLCAAKGSIGHTLGAAGALDVLAALLALNSGWLPPVTGLRQQDPTLDVDAVQGKPRRHGHAHALVATAGFGGLNAAVLVRRSGGGK